MTAGDVIAGVAGSPLPYSPRTDNVIALTLVVCLALTAIALARSKGFLSQQVKDFVQHRERTSIFDNSTAGDMRYLMVLIVQTCILSGITAFNVSFAGSHPTLPAGSHTPLLLLALCVGSCIVYFLLKWVVYMFLGWIFFDNSLTKNWLESYSTLIYYTGFILFPFVLCQIYLGLEPTRLLIIAAIILILAKILMFYKWLKLFFGRLGSLFPLILYFCALEILPCLLLYKGMEQMNMYCY
ncbi:MAG: DUF4271 domain-containing protein [Mediterranea sp.]|jgi:hypothetical protein|nr:DUF4271 domain-containing protein [Mediterranea sp.]